MERISTAKWGITVTAFITLRTNNIQWNKINKLLQFILQDKLNGSRGVGKRRIS